MALSSGRNLSPRSVAFKSESIAWLKKNQWCSRVHLVEVRFQWFWIRVSQRKGHESPNPSPILLLDSDATPLQVSRYRWGSRDQWVQGLWVRIRVQWLPSPRPSHEGPSSSLSPSESIAWLENTRHRKYYRRWMLYVGLFLPWLNGAASYLLPALGTSAIVNGVCIVTAFWPSQIMAKVRTALRYGFKQITICLFCRILQGAIIACRRCNFQILNSLQTHR